VAARISSGSAIDRSDDIRQCDLLRRASQPVAAVGAALTVDQPGVTQVAEDVLEK
jgi:hypothetical protein